MNATTFDALAAARDLEAAGFERRQAEALAESMRNAAAADLGTLATKADLNVLRTATKADLAELRSDISGLESRMYRALWIQGGAIVAILTALRFLPV